MITRIECLPANWGVALSDVFLWRCS